MMQNKFLMFLTVLASAMTGFAVANASFAQIAASPCDPDYYESLESRAWLEAQREITQNQNLILKPDSVLEYTCFDKQLREVADHATQMFSETVRWGGDVIEDQATSMDTALTDLVSKAFKDYDEANFNHTLLGGRLTSWSPVTQPKGMTGVAYTPEDAVPAGQSYECGVMQAVWVKAKCMAFAESLGNDGFFTFDDYASGDDKRFKPSVCPSVPIWGSEINTAYKVTPWTDDDVVTYLDQIFPTSGCGPSGGTRIKTGMYVTDSKASVKEHFEYACIVPGCYWEPTGEDTGSCKRP